MIVNFVCPRCGTEARAGGASWDVVCTGCGGSIRLEPSAAVLAGDGVDRCAVCGAEAFYLQKDINRNLGLVVVALGGLMVFWNFLIGIGVLVLLAIADWALYRMLPDATVCYACKSVYREGPKNPTHRGYELTVDEAFEGSGNMPAVVGGSEPNGPVAPTGQR